MTNLQHFDEAAKLLTRALESYQDLGQLTLAASTLIQLGVLYFSADAPHTAIAAYEAALDLLSPRDESALYLTARFNLAHTLFEVGEIIEARERLHWDEELYVEYADEHLAIRYTWLDGRIAAATGKPRQAEKRLTETRDHFAARGDGFDAALVSLDLAHLYQRLGRTEDLLQTVTSAVRLFSVYALHREALAALIMLRDAVREQTATAETIERVAGFLREAAKDPEARFQPPS